MKTKRLEKSASDGRFSTQFKNRLIEEIGVGFISEVNAINKYNLSPKLLRAWRRRRYYHLTKIRTMKEIKRKSPAQKIRELENEVKKLNKENAELRLASSAYHKMLKIAEETYEIPLRKKYGTKQ